MSKQVQRFYDSMAGVYHLIYEDWETSIARQARALDALLQRRLGSGPLRILDCACGIGTQSLGLAALGHHVTGTDISPAAVNRARQEAQKRGLAAEFHVSDMTQLAEFPAGHFDVVGAWDNALPHLSARQLTAACQAFHRVLRPGGTFVASLRDYDVLLQERPTVQGPSFFGVPGERRIVHQVWDWIARDRYEVHQYISLEADGDWESFHFHAEYRCLLRREVDATLRAAGFREIEWFLPKDSGFYQPIVAATSA